MHVGMGVIFQGQGEGRTDRNVYRNELRLGDLAEPLGFESLWGVEHHFTDYTMCPDVLQYLTYFAGRTRAIQLGSMVAVLPWHHPVRVAEQQCKRFAAEIMPKLKAEVPLAQQQIARARPALAGGAQAASA